ncbi:tripartite tricarboxylate transporter substrate-binding protein [Rhodovarius sp.]|uniref:tripartite tricarboxylate transporter substrate-binding protein n=1 Tax=Rhodovarius sp. TaxID=2972673 RepID=UPI0033403374
MSSILRRAVLGMPLAGLAAPALAQAFPARPLTMIVPFAAGGPTDTVARLIAQEMGRDMGGSVVVENVAGAGGTLGAQRVAMARPDGYTILCHHIGMGVIPSLYRRLAYDAVNGFETIGMVTEVPMTIVGKRDLPANNLTELVALIRQRREGLNMANAGIGAASHLCGLLFQSALGVAMTTVPYRGTGPAMNDLVGGTVDLLCDQTTNTTEHIRAGTIRAYAVTTSARVASLPDLPTANEAGMAGFAVSVWHGLYAPRGTPADIVNRLSTALQHALAVPALVSRFADLGTAPVPAGQATAAYHRQFWAADIARWRPVIEAASAYAD